MIPLDVADLVVIAEHVLGIRTSTVLEQADMRAAETALAEVAVFMARQEARRLGHGSVDPEHLLLGLIRVGTGSGISALDKLDVNRDALRQQLEESTGHSPGQADGPVRFSRPRGQMVLVSALLEALAHDTTDICTADLLLAQYRDDGPVSRTLARLGATEDRVRETVAAPAARSRKFG